VIIKIIRVIKGQEGGGAEGGEELEEGRSWRRGGAGRRGWSWKKGVELEEGGGAGRRGWSWKKGGGGSVKSITSPCRTY
jgi:hypothetical protein